MLIYIGHRGVSTKDVYLEVHSFTQDDSNFLGKPILLTMSVTPLGCQPALCLLKVIPRHIATRTLTL